MASRLWKACLDGHRAGLTPIERLAATVDLYDCERDPFGNPDWVTLAWVNGAWAASAGVSLARIEALVGNHVPKASRLLRAITQAQSLAEGIERAYGELRYLLDLAMGDHAETCGGSLQTCMEVSAVAGWLAFEKAHLITARAMTEDSGAWPQRLFFPHLLNEVRGWNPAEAVETVARVFSAAYRAEEEVERHQITRAAGASLRAARRHGWSVCEFVADAQRWGEGLVRRHPEVVKAIMQATGLLKVKWMTELFEECFGHPLKESRREEALGAFRRMETSAHKLLVRQMPNGAGLMVLWDAYDMVWWVGLLRAALRAESLAGWLSTALDGVNSPDQMEETAVHEVSERTSRI